jgi:hypothetical protein
MISSHKQSIDTDTHPPSPCWLTQQGLQQPNAGNSIADACREPSLVGLLTAQGCQQPTAGLNTAGNACRKRDTPVCADVLGSSSAQPAITAPLHPALCSLACWRPASLLAFPTKVLLRSHPALLLSIVAHACLPPGSQHLTLAGTAGRRIHACLC